MTSHAAIEAAAFALFESKGFEATTMEDIAESVGVGRRTLFRYYASKNDIPWGQFDAGLVHFARELDSMPTDLPVYKAVHQGILSFNRYDEDALPQHRRRMRLLLHTPALQAHSALRYAQWRRVIAEYVANRCGTDPDDLLPRLIGHVSLALAVAAYELWLDDETATLDSALDGGLAQLRQFYLESI